MIRLTLLIKAMGTLCLQSSTGISDLWCQHHLGVSDANPGNNTKIRNLVPATFVADLNFDQLRLGCQQSSRIDGRARLGTPEDHEMNSTDEKRC